MKAGFEWRVACLAGYSGSERLPRCAAGRIPTGFPCEADIWNAPDAKWTTGSGCPVASGVLAAMRYLADCPAGRLFSFRLSGSSLEELNAITEGYLMTQLEQSFSALDFYKSLFPHIQNE